MSHTGRPHQPARDVSPPCRADAKGAGIGFLCVIIFICFVALPVSAPALERQEAARIPHVNQQARNNFLEYIYAENNKAFAIAPGGAWAWSALEPTAEEARRNALQNCQSHTQQRCVLYALNDQVVFNRQAWAQLWRLDKRPAAKLEGIRRGANFPDLQFTSVNGKLHHLSDFKGSPVLLHFWGSWCPPCMREMPLLLQLQQALKKEFAGQIKLVLLQVREPFDESLRWARQQQFARLPLYDSGITSDSDGTMRAANGKTVQDRELARAFPTSYVLDQQGRVLFSRTGPVDDWLEYLPFFRDIVKQTK